jgi:predicted nucleic acid-binding protein
MPSQERVFVDTNILVYAHSAANSSKEIKARELVKTLWSEEGKPVISVQVLQELHVNLIKAEVDRDQVEEIIVDYMDWKVIDNSRQLLLDAIQEQARWKLSLWDSLILAAAREAECNILFSEDFSNRENYGGIKAINPLT